MTPRRAPADTGFSGLAAAMAGQPLHEVGPGGAGEEPAALGFTLGLAAHWAGRGAIFWVGEDAYFAEEGAPYPPGLVDLGIDLKRLIVIRAVKREDALWAAEQGLAAQGAVVVCALGARGRPLDLKATRRLLLFAERNRSRCLLLRPPADASAAWTRWLVRAAPSVAEARELGAPAYAIELTRRRMGPAGARFIVEWNTNERSFMARDLSAALEHGSGDPRRARAQ